MESRIFSSQASWSAVKARAGGAFLLQPVGEALMNVFLEGFERSSKFDGCTHEADEIGDAAKRGFPGRVAHLARRSARLARSMRLRSASFASGA